MSDRRDADVVPLFPGADQTDDDAPVRNKPRTSPVAGGCIGPCLKVELDGDARRVYCRVCGNETPAFDYLTNLAREFERYTGSRKEAQRRAKVAQANLDELERKERNAKARVRKAERKLGTVSLRTPCPYSHRWQVPEVVGHRFTVHRCARCDEEVIFA